MCDTWVQLHTAGAACRESDGAGASIILRELHHITSPLRLSALTVLAPDSHHGGSRTLGLRDAQVLEERKAQVEVKLQAVRVDKQNQAEARRRLEVELDAVNTLEKAKLDEAAQIRMTHRSLLENQIKEKAFKRAAAEFNKAQERMTAERAEAAYQMMLHDQMAKTTTTMNAFAK